MQTDGEYPFYDIEEKTIWTNGVKFWPNAQREKN